ncbi:MAG: glycosyltransferase family 2 protein [Chromatiaceae bacterium]|nr:glycosyltransferase family 2 protein [Chromatiaceae bacterium]
MIATAIAYIVFNRPEHTRTTFAAIRAEQPALLFIIADGPRPNNSADAVRCEEVRQIVEEVDWPCEVKHNYADRNLGCKARVSSGLDWVFSHVDQAIILEDDCLPHPDFFGFCDTLLHRYVDDERVWAITGDNFQSGQRRGNAAYYFSKYPHCWGWATWRRAWRHYDGDLSFWPSWRQTQAWAWSAPDLVERRYWEGIFDRMARNEIDTWDYPWTASVWFGGGLTATPNVNLVSNIGFGPDATHTAAAVHQDGLPSARLGPLTHPKQVRQNLAADRYVFDHQFGGSRLRPQPRLHAIARRILKRITLGLRLSH